ncbi:hypothetical protein LEL_08977 [Akanthomyces lecanii RCEF 1005]|uniref:BRCT domain-containing protein n=1 Tax=Akanthomyces lecanii RCEF 1005 TaxID=1081108 RepID=A0A162JP63_CORDF|nr:hypothetical protein LEL_08977 [Akanthomyces lecanii RCEF 1005]
MAELNSPKDVTLRLAGSFANKETQKQVTAKLKKLGFDKFTTKDDWDVLVATKDAFTQKGASMQEFIATQRPILKESWFDACYKANKFIKPQLGDYFQAPKRQSVESGILSPPASKENTPDPEGTGESSTSATDGTANGNTTSDQANTAPSDPANTAPSDPANTAPSDPANTAPSDPANTAPSDPANTAPSDPANTAPSDPANTAPSDPANTAPSDPANTAPSDPANTAPSDPANTAPSDPANTAPSDPANTAPSDPANTAPSDPANTAPSDPANTAPSDPANTAPSDPANTAPSDPANTAPSDPANTAPSDPANTAPSDPANTAPSDPANTAPSDPANTAPSDPANTAPSDPANTAPSDPANTAPSDPANTAPSDPANTAPSDPASTTPSDPASTTPSDPANTTPSDPANSVGGASVSAAAPNYGSTQVLYFDQAPKGRECLPVRKKHLDWCKDERRLLLTYHPADQFKPWSQRRSGKYEVTIECVVGTGYMIVTLPDSSNADLPCARAGFLLRKSDYPLAAEAYVKAADKITPVSAKSELVGRGMADFVWWTIAAGARMCYLMGVLDGETKPRVFTRSTFKSAFGVIADRQINDILQSFGQEPLKKAGQKQAQMLVKVR